MQKLYILNVYILMNLDFLNFVTFITVPQRQLLLISSVLTVSGSYLRISEWSSWIISWLIMFTH